MKKVLFLWALLLLSLTSLSCQKDHTAHETPTEATPQATTPADTSSQIETVYEATGRVVKIMPNKRFIVLKHGPIEGLMDGMSMPFEIQNEALLEGLQPEDSVRFTFTTSTGIQSIEKID